MTINIALATYDGIILGCDSLSSITSQVIFPFEGACDYAVDADGNFMRDGAGKMLIPVTPGNVTQIATTVFGGVSKMFCLYEDDDTCVAALTSGLAVIGGVTIAEQAKRYRRRNKVVGTVFTSVDAVAKDFLAFMRELWDEQYGKTPAADQVYLSSVNFIVAGFGKDETYGKIFQLDVQRNGMFEQFDEGDHMGVCWAGQSNYVERLLKGVDPHLVYKANRQIAEALTAQRDRTVKDISDSLDAANVVLPEDLDITITEEVPPGIPWDTARADVDYSNLSNQYAIDLVETLVNTQSGMQRFARGIPTVGGRTHIGVIKRGEGFKVLNGPELQHKHTGYSDEY